MPTDLVVARRLLDHTRRNGVSYRRTEPGEDGPLLGIRESDEWRDTVYIAGFSGACFAMRERKSSLLVASGALVERSVEGSALNVLNELLTWPWTERA